MSAGRYARTWRRFWATALAAEMEYRVNFLVELTATLGNLAGSLFVLGLLFGPAAGSGTGLGGWSWEGALLVLGAYTLLDGVASTLLHPNLGSIVTQVQRGTLDFVLLKPIDSQFWLSLRTFSPWGLPGVAAGLGLMLYALARLDRPPGWWAAGQAVAMLLASCLLLYALWFVLAASSIWFVKIWNATEVLRSTLAAGRYPVQAYPIGLRIFLTFVLPVAFLTTVPAEALLGRATPAELVGSLLVAATAAVLSRRFWHFALAHYTSASS
jgi:ABC-2 type transport system permease protein